MEFLCPECNVEYKFVVESWIDPQKNKTISKDSLKKVKPDNKPRPNTTPSRQNSNTSRQNSNTPRQNSNTRRQNSNTRRQNSNTRRPNGDKQDVCSCAIL